jgi:hypothetical protein
MHENGEKKGENDRLTNKKRKDSADAKENQIHPLSLPKTHPTAK